VFHTDLDRLAHRERRRVVASDTLRTTAVVHEAYLKLYPGGQGHDRAHSLNTAAMAMRQALVQRARTPCAAERGGAAVPLLEEVDSLVIEPEENLDAPNDAGEPPGANRGCAGVRVVEWKQHLLIFLRVPPRKL
jgi:hypothetical protein